MGVTVVLSMGPYYQLEHSNPTQQRNLPCWWHPARQWCQPTCSGLSACFMFWADAIHKTQPNFQNTLMETVVLINEKKMATVVTHLMKSSLKSTAGLIPACIAWRGKYFVIISLTLHGVPWLRRPRAITHLKKPRLNQHSGQSLALQPAVHTPM